MHVTIERTGGFAGIPLMKSIDASTLTVSENENLCQLIETAHFFQLPELIAGSPQPDRFEYQIIIEHEGGKHSVTVAEHAMPAELKPLVDWLMKSGQPVK